MDLLRDMCSKGSLSRYCYYIAWNPPLIWPMIFAKSLIVAGYLLIPITSAWANDRNS